LINKRLLIAAITFFALSIDFAHGQDLAKKNQHEQALALNKSGQFLEAAKILHALMLSHPEIERYKLDYIAVLSNAKRCDDVIAISKGNYAAKAPPYVQIAIFSCYADTQEFSKTENFVRSILKIQGKNEALILRMTALARERKEFQSANYWSERFLKDYPNNISAWEMRAGVLQDMGNRFAALHIYEDIKKLRPSNQNIQENIIQILLDMGMPHLALELINNKKWYASNTQRLRAIHDSGAVNLRWGIADSAVAPNRFTSTDIGIETLNNSLAYAKSIQANSDRIASIQYDLIVAYTKRKQWDKSLAIYDELSSIGNIIPDYALSAVAASYSGKLQYAKAGNILQTLYAKKPDDLDIGLDLYFNLVDQDQFAAAKPILDKLTSQLKVYPKYLPKRSFDYTRAMIEAVNFEAYQEKYQEANSKLIPLLSDIPSNSDLLKTAGSLSQSQDMHQASANYFEIAAKQDPQDVEAKIGYANARMSQGDIPTFIATVHELMPGYSDINSVKNASERLDMFQEGYVTGNFVLGNGDYLGQTNNNRTSDLRVYSAPINDNFRGFARYRDLNSGPAISVTDQGAGGGLRYTGINQDAEVELGSSGYLRAEGTQTLNDYWAISASFEKNAFYLMPGSLYAISGGNVGGINVNWKNGHGTNAMIGYRYWSLTNNNKQEIYGNVNQRLLTEYNYKLDLSGWVGNQQNSNSNVGYFSPSNQTAYTGTLNLRILQWRDIATKKYDFWHRFYASYGVVTQAGYSTLPMNNYGYGQDFNIGDRRTLSWGVGKTRFPFDGARSSYITGYLNFESRF
jgi:poly-beta-1,6 N-acetyl-D-glucosamine export porin PgaA